MKRPFKVMSTASVAAVAATSFVAVSPVSAAADAQIDEVNFEINGQTVTESADSLNYLKNNPDVEGHDTYFNNDGDLKNPIETVQVNDKTYDPAALNYAKSQNPDGGMSDWVEAADPVNTEASVDSVSAINPKEASVTMNTELKEVSKDNLTVTNQDGEKQYVKSVEVVEPEAQTFAAGESTNLKVEFYNDLKSGDTYTFSVDVDGETVSSDLEFEIGEATTIETETTQTVQHNSGEVNLSKALDYKVLDENGLDITSSANVSFETTAEFKNDSDSVINLGADDTAFVYVVANDKDSKELVKSERISVKAEDSTLAEITDWTIADKSPEDASLFESKNYEQNTTVQMNTESSQFVHIAGKDQFGETNYPDTVKYESLDKTVALVDRNSGEIKPLKEGKVPVKVTSGDVTKTIEAEVVADAKAATLEVEDTEVSISNQITDPTKLDVDVKDQYGNGYTLTGDEEINIEVLSGKDVVDASFADGKLSIAPKNEKSGNATVEVKVNDDVKTTVNVNVTEAGAVDDYTVEGFENELDKNGDKNDDTEDKMNLSVYPVDADGVKTGQEPSNVEYEVKDEDGKVVSTNNPVDANATEESGSNDVFKAGETYTVTAKVGSIEVFSDSFNIVDTEEKASVDFTNSTIDAENLDFLDDLNEIVNSKDADGNDSSVTAATFTSDNDDVIADDGVDYQGEGEATLVMDTVTVDNDEISVDDIITLNVDFSEMASSPKSRVKQGATQVSGVEYNYNSEKGKATLSYNSESADFSGEDQNPNTDLGANEKHLYHGVRVDAPDTAKYVSTDGGKLLEIGQHDLTYENPSDGAGIFGYYPVGYENADGDNIAFTDNKTWTKVYTWFNADKEVIGVDKLDVERIADAEENAETTGE
ncbi:hypothetical protein GCM10028778_17910 [Barrientosiimonas marina]|uniref:Ig-like domain-containing protein n=1 Tax=Lentibacillus kimchii TaxID=1542911 RepID=A0ABW2UVQ7_9BACI